MKNLIILACALLGAVTLLAGCATTTYRAPNPVVYTTPSSTVTTTTVPVKHTTYGTTSVTTTY